MKAEELRSLGVEELKSKAVEMGQELFNLKFQLHTGHLENSSLIAKTRKDIARINTIVIEKQG